MAMPPAVGLTYDQIWKNFQIEYLRHSNINDLKRIHDKWKAIAAQVK